MQCNLVDIQYQQKIEALYTFTSNKSYSYLLNTEPRNLFTERNDRQLEIEDKFNLILLINK